MQSNRLHTASTQCLEEASGAFQGTPVLRFSCGSAEPQYRVSLTTYAQRKDLVPLVIRSQEQGLCSASGLTVHQLGVLGGSANHVSTESFGPRCAISVFAIPLTAYRVDCIVNFCAISVNKVDNAVDPY